MTDLNAHFDALYQASADPWSVTTAWYERRKRAMLMAVLPRERYRHALELGCGNGATTCLLAERCDAVCAVDSSPAAIAQCAHAVAAGGFTNVQLDVCRLPDTWPLQQGEPVDLIVVSELAYYFTDADLDRLLVQCTQALAQSGDWLMCHDTRPFHDRLQDTARIHDKINKLGKLCRIVAHNDEQFRLEVWRRRSELAT